MSTTTNDISDVAARYNQKIREFCDGIDPFTLRNETCALPRNVGYFDVYHYCIERDSSYTHAAFKAYKSLDAYQYFENGWVQSIVCKRISRGFIIVAKVIHRLKK